MTVTRIYALMITEPQQFGRDSESVAVRYLAENGYEILERNYRSPWGEIDIIAKDGDTIVFAEVKSVRTNHFGHPKSAVTWQKQRKISITAQHWLKTSRQSRAKARFDVVAIRSEKNNTVVELIRNAFGIVG